MDLKSIVLKEVPFEVFIKMRNYWALETEKPKHSSEVYSRICNPIVAEDYESLIHLLQKCEHAQELCVRKGAHHWEKRDIKKLSDSEIKELAKIASEDRYQKDHLEIKIKKNECCKRTTIRFVKFNGKIIGYDTLVPYPLSGLVTIEADIPDEKNGRIKGLWVPDSYIQTLNHFFVQT